MFQSTTTSYISTEGGKRMRVDPDNSGPTRSTSAPSQGVDRGDAKRRKIAASSDHSGIGAIQSADMPAQPPVSKKVSKRRRSDDESSDANPRPTKRSHHDDTLAPRPTNKKPSKRRRSSDDESSDAGLRPTKKIQMEDVHAEAEEAQNPTVDCNIPVGGELPTVQEELSVQFSAHCTSRKFDKRSLPTNFLTETEEEVDLIKIGSSLWPVEEEEEACEEEACEEEDVVVPNAMGEIEAATKIQALFRRHYHYHGLPGLNDDEDEEPVARRVRYNVNELPPAFLEEDTYPKVHPMYHPMHGVQSRAHLMEIGAVRPEPSSETQVEFDTAMVDDVMDENDGLESVDVEIVADNASDNESVEVVGAVEEEEEEEEEEVEVQIAPRRPRRKRMLIELQCSLDGRYWSQAATRRCIVRD
eukprot:scaffold5054_cov109-Skeletonema_marinoi.AAC.2